MYQTAFRVKPRPAPDSPFWPHLDKLEDELLTDLRKQPAALAIAARCRKHLTEFQRLCVA